MDNLTEKVASKYLGKNINTDILYNPEFLVAIPRFENRKQYNIDETNLPFSGWDIWHCYEFSTLTSKGLPVMRVIKLKYNANSKYIIESKSLKLYLNSFNMSKFGDNINECLAICKDIITKDLSKKLETSVEINFMDITYKRNDIFNDFYNIMELIDENSLEIKNYKETPQLLQTEILDKITEHKLKFDSLRSNCRVTHQPDFGDIFIYYESKKHILEESIVKYLCSFRTEFHFHEECTEMIFKRLHDILEPNDKLLVTSLYTRRGGIDICPVRYSKYCDTIEVDKLTDIKTFARYGIKQ